MQLGNQIVDILVKSILCREKMCQHAVRFSFLFFPISFLSSLFFLLFSFLSSLFFISSSFLLSIRVVRLLFLRPRKGDDL